MAFATEFDDDFRCAPWTAGQGYDPIGSATRFEHLVTVEVPLPWPRDVGDIAWVEALDDVPAGTRIQTIVPEVAREDGGVLVSRWDLAGARFVGTDWVVGAGDVPAALAAIVVGEDPGGAGAPAPDEILVCGHGARDRCCGGPGTRLTLEARAELGTEVRVRRTSHLGGHRYAPTAITLPDGRMWAFLDADVLSGIVRRTLQPSAAREYYRGNAVLGPWAQVVEAAVLEERGWSELEFDELTASSEVGDDGDRAAVELSWTSHGVTDERSATVEVTTRYPVIQCGLDPSHAEKSAPEYRLASR